MFRCLSALLLSITILSTSCNTLTPNKKQKCETIYDSVIIDLVIVRGNNPDPEALKTFIKKLKEYNICKEVLIIRRVEVDYSITTWITSFIRRFEKLHRSFYDKTPKDKQLIIFICYLPGVCVWKDSTNICGIKYNKTSFAIFRHKVDTEYEAHILVHEFGHILGLANSSKRSKQKPANTKRPNHCNNRDCVMYWSTTTKKQDFDDECKKEIQELIKKGIRPQ